ncbi:Hypothetical protein SRAE_2000282600 [Strongyloides ratti]|uniref:Uncharacterized protein n=1 Tax=Strongyloides ratti TaxID=34506 RepID=A0A090LJ48_STRRB|nr:Hypothetical protein SRAE_2000282600 [Strongyloides ratti]CEF68168.1 Hypothetical protein SRAE_2000282600 [Strongyloides ratti]
MDLMDKTNTNSDKIKSSKKNFTSNEKMSLKKDPNLSMKDNKTNTSKKSNKSQKEKIVYNNRHDVLKAQLKNFQLGAPIDCDGGAFDKNVKITNSVKENKSLSDSKKKSISKKKVSSKKSNEKSSSKKIKTNSCSKKNTNVSEK